MRFPEVNRTKFQIEISRSQSNRYQIEIFQKNIDMQTIPLSQILQMNPIVRPIDLAGADVWIRVPDEETFLKAKPTLRKYSDPLTEFPRPLRHWKVRTHTEPIRLYVFVADSRTVWTAEGYDFEIEYLEDVIDTFGADNVKVSCRNIDARKKGR